MKSKLFYSAFLIVVLAASACASAAPSSGTATNAPVAPATGAPVGTASSAPVGTATMAPVGTATMAPVGTPGAVVPVTGATSTGCFSYPSGASGSGSSSTVGIGCFLVNSSGMTLYVFAKDTQATSSSPAVSACTGSCTSLWMPVTASSTPSAGMGVDSSMLGSFTRSDGTVQATYNGWPLYTFAHDTAAGNVNGQGFKGLWSMITVQGTVLTTAAAVATAAPAQNAPAPQGTTAPVYNSTY